MRELMGQVDPHLPVNREPIGMVVSFQDGSKQKIRYINARKFIQEWNNLDHTNLTSATVLQKGTYYEKVNGVRRLSHYRTIVFSNDPDSSHYWLEETGRDLFSGYSRDIPPGAHAYPNNIRPDTRVADNIVGRTKDFVE